MAQTDDILKVLSDFSPHSSFEIIERVYRMDCPSVARLGARIYDLKGKGHDIKSWIDKENRKKCWYQLIKKPIQLSLI